MVTGELREFEASKAFKEQEALKDRPATPANLALRSLSLSLYGAATRRLRDVSVALCAARRGTERERAPAQHLP